MMSWWSRAATFALATVAVAAAVSCGSKPIRSDGGGAGTIGAGGSGAGGAGTTGAGGSGGNTAGVGGGSAGGRGGACTAGGAFEIRRTSTGYEIEVTDPPDRPCPDAALVCVLQIGDLCFGRFGYAPQNGHRVYPLTDAEFAMLQSGAPVSGYYGNPPGTDHACGASQYPDAGTCPLFGYIE